MPRTTSNDLDDLYVADLERPERTAADAASTRALWKQLQLVPVERDRRTRAPTAGTSTASSSNRSAGETGKKYPMILTIHGGPAGMYGVDWYHEFQVYASRGWAVFFTNPRGSTGYGAEVRARHRGELGRQRLRRRDERRRRGRCAAYPWIDTRASRRHRRQLRRLPDELDHRPHEPCSRRRSRSAASPTSSATRARATARTATRTTSAATSSRSSISTGTRSPLKYAEERQDADAHAPLRQRLPRARSSRASSGSARCGTSA